MTKLRVLDLFSGIGGFSLGLERTGGFETVAFCEIEPYPRAVLAKHWPHVPCYEDVRTLTADTLARDGIAVDVICGGFPCQDLSFAGKRAGLEGARSGLWGEYARLIGELRPRFVIVENVPGLLSLGMGTVLGDLAALGYDATWDCIPAAAVGAPHRRDRVWIVAYARGEQREGCCIEERREGAARLHEDAPDPDRHSKHAGAVHAETCGASEPMADANQFAGHQRRAGDAAQEPRGRHVDRSCQCEIGIRNANVSGLALPERQSRDVGEELTSPVGADWWVVEPDVGRVAARLSSELDRGECGKEKHAAEAGAEGHGRSNCVPSLRSDRGFAEASPGLFQSRSGRSAMPSVSHQGGSKRWDAPQADAENVHPVRQGVHADAQQETQPMQPGMPFDRWPHECDETLGQIWSAEPDVGRVAVGVQNRVDRLRALGNAVVPQVVEAIGRAILQAEGMTP